MSGREPAEGVSIEPAKPHRIIKQTKKRFSKGHHHPLEGEMTWCGFMKSDKKRRVNSKGKTRKG